MKTRPILFSAPMVRALLDGTKTQTRRIVTRNNSVLGSGTWPEDGLARAFPQTDDSKLMLPGEDESFHRLYPRWDAGDRLWVRETCRAHEITDSEADNDTFGIVERMGLEQPPYGFDGVVYRADGAFREIENTREASDAWSAMNHYRGKRGAIVPPIHMPRWASRITLEIVAVRVERLRDISEADAKAEGCSVPLIIYPDESRESYSYAAAYRHLWESINGEGSWAVNPYVWCLTFQRVTP